MTRTRSILISAGICLALLLLTRLPVTGAPPMQFYQPYVVNLALLVNQVTPLPTATLAPSATPIPVGTIGNGDFEQGHAVWGEVSTQSYDLITTSLGGISPHSGAWAAWMVRANNETSLIEQTVTVSKQTPYVSYWMWISSSDVCGYDVAGVIIDNGTNQDATVLDGFWLCRDTATGGWRRRTVDVHSYIGKTITLGWIAGNDVSSSSRWYVDTISMQANKQSGLVDIVDPVMIARLQSLAHRP